MRKMFFLPAFVFLVQTVHAQLDARLFRHPDISQQQICFVYGGDIWIVAKTGGTALRITSSTGEESFPRFSLDGKTIAFTATYDGNADVYTIPVTGGVPSRLTWHAMHDRVVEWHPDGNSILIASARESGSQAFRQFYLLDKKGGLPVKLPVPYGELASFSPDGNHLAYVTRITENYPFKRYRGGMASDIIVFDLKNKSAENITRTPATEGKPAWYKNRIYYVSDGGANKRRNVYVYDRSKKSHETLSSFDREDVNYMSAGADDLVFEAGGKLYTMNLASNKYAEVKINVLSDNAGIMHRTVSTANRVTSFDLSPDAKRAVFEARGELFSVPAENGVVFNLTNSSRYFERSPAWSPNGKYIAYWSDQSGENEIYLRNIQTSASPKKLTSFEKGMGWNLYWSPDSKKIAFINDRQEINVLTVESETVTVIDKTTQLTFSALQGFEMSWSPDSKWLAYSKGLSNQNEALFLYHLEKKKLFQATSGYYNDSRPVFDPTGKYIFFATDRNFSPSYSGLDGTWIYPNTTQLAYATVEPDVKTLMPPKNDEVKIIDTSSKDNAAKKSSDTAKKLTPPIPEAIIMAETLENRMELIPVTAGNYGQIYAAEGKLIYVRYPNTGAVPGPGSIYLFDIEKKEEKTLLAGAGGFVVSADRKSLLARSGPGFGIVTLNPDQRIEKPLRISEMEMVLSPRDEWKQIFDDTWRRYRDFFYDPNMHKVDWNAIRKQYGAMVDDAITRWDLSNIQVEMISELSAGHTYAGGGDVEQSSFRIHGFLGIDWALENGAYRIKRIVRPAKWDHEVRSPFDGSGVQVKEGDYILAVNGITINNEKDPYAAFEGQAGKTVLITVNSKPVPEGAKEVLVKTLTPFEESRLRHLEWIEMNRKKVDELSGGQLGYMYMPNTGGQGQTELMRQFYAQIDKKGFIIDERFNAGGQLADRFIEMLNRPVLYNLAWRNADVTVWPNKGNNGPKVMLINGWAGSGGDAFPWAFQQLKLGPIVGERTLGILVGPATGHTLIDGGYITVPDARLYSADGKWFAEGYGIKPEIEIWDDPAKLAKGEDPQLIRGVEEAMKLLPSSPRKLYPRPSFEDRSAKGIRD